MPLAVVLLALAPTGAWGVADVIKSANNDEFDQPTYHSDEGDLVQFQHTGGGSHNVTSTQFSGGERLFSSHPGLHGQGDQGDHEAARSEPEDRGQGEAQPEGTTSAGGEARQEGRAKTKVEATASDQSGATASDKIKIKRKNGGPDSDAGGCSQRTV
jgi:hypothetical protein